MAVATPHGASAGPTRLQQLRASFRELTSSCHADVAVDRPKLLSEWQRLLDLYKAAAKDDYDEYDELGHDQHNAEALATRLPFAI